MEIKKVYSLGLTKELIKIGYKVINISYNFKQNKQIYEFENSEEFAKDFDKLSKLFANNRKY